MFYPIASLVGNLEADAVDGYGDGTICAWVGDDQGRGTQICIDGRKGSPTRNRLFEQARHPRMRGAALIDLGAPDEGIVVPLLSRWLDSDKALKWLTRYGKEMVQAALLRLGEPTEPLGVFLLEIVLPQFLEPTERGTIEIGLDRAVKAARLGLVTGGGCGGGISDFFVGISDVPAGVALIRRVLAKHDRARGAIIKQYEPLRVVHHMEE